MDDSYADLAVSEVLKENKVPASGYKEIDHMLQKLQRHISAMSAVIDKKLRDVNWLKHSLDVFYPIIDQPDPKSAEIPFEFHPPNVFTAIDDYEFKTLIKRDACVRLAVEIPDAMLTYRDHLNQNYHRKRAKFLSIIGASLRSSDLVKSVEFWVENSSDTLKPLLRIVPAGKFGKKYQILLYPCVSRNFWKLDRFSLNASNIRLQWYFNTGGKIEEADNLTPVYNHSVLSDILLREQQQRIEALFKHFTHIIDGLTLIRAWLSLRSLNVPWLFIACFLCHMIKHRRFLHHASRRQIFRSFVTGITHSTLDSQGLSLAEDVDLLPFLAHFSIVFIDFSGTYNICYQWNKSDYYNLKHECALATKQLDSMDQENVASLFVEKATFSLKYDLYFQVELSDQLKSSLTNQLTKSELADSAGNIESNLIKSISSVLERAIGSRTLLIECQNRNFSSWPLDQPPPNSPNKLNFGILYNPDTYNSLLDKGPSADSDEAADFREFWGEKSEMRKFADTSICEAVVWPANNQMKSRAVVEQIIKFVINRHCKLPPDALKFNGREIEEIAAVYSPIRGWLGSGEEQFRELKLIFEELVHALNLLEDLPLRINKIIPVSPILRRTEVLPPSPISVDKIVAGHYVRGKWIVPRAGALFAPPWCPSIKVQLTLESSNKWPDDIEAIRRLKTAFYLQIAQLLEKQIGITSNASMDCLYVFYKGFVFCLYIAYFREITLLKMTKNESGVVEMKENEAANQLDKDLNERPKISSLINGLVQQFPSYALTVRCFKRWLCCHMLSDYLCDELMEILVARVYLAPFPYSTPTSCFSAFLRVLRLLVAHDWLTSPLIVNFNDELDDQKLAGIRSNFVTLRPTLPLMCVATPQDLLGVLWTRPQPTSMILERLIQIADGSLRFIENNLLEKPFLDIRTVFRTPLDAYDILIRVNVRQMPKKSMSLDRRTTHFKDDGYSMREKIRKTKKLKRALPQKDGKILPIVDYDPVTCFVRDIRLKHDDKLMCFYDKYGGDTIGLLLKPNIKVNISGLLDSIRKIGSGLIDTVQIMRDCS